MTSITLQVEVSYYIKTLRLVELVHPPLPLLLVLQAGLNIDLLFPLEIALLEENEGEDPTAEIVGTKIHQFVHQKFMREINVP